MSGTPRAPEGAQEAGRRLWRAVLAEFELSEGELALLREAVAVVDTCHELQAAVAAAGPLVEGKPNPVLAELRMQRLLLGRLLVALRIPAGEMPTRAVVLPVLSAAVFAASTASGRRGHEAQTALRCSAGAAGWAAAFRPVGGHVREVDTGPP